MHRYINLQRIQQSPLEVQQPITIQVNLKKNRSGLREGKHVVLTTASD